MPAILLFLWILALKYAVKLNFKMGFSYFYLETSRWGLVGVLGSEGGGENVFIFCGSFPAIYPFCFYYSLIKLGYVDTY